MTFCATPAPEPSNLVLVAEIDGDLNDAYHLTQNIEESWAQNTDSKVKAKCDECRSTSVGDVMEKDGVFYVVASFGFDVLEGYSVTA